MNMKKLLLLTMVIGGAFFLGTHDVKAGDCYADPVAVHDWTGTTNIGAFVRDQACMDGSAVLTTIPKSTSVRIIGETDGWYRVEWNGTRGWVGSSLMSVTQKRFEGNVWDSYADYMKTYPSVKGSASPDPAPEEVVPVVVTAESIVEVKTTTDSALMSRLKGYILLQTQSHGEAWYVDPVSSKRYYMKDGPTAYQMMRSFGLGITETDYAKLSNDTALKSRLRGRIVLRAQAHGEAYYIHPKDLSVYYLKNGEEAYRVMRLYSLGITNTDLAKLATSIVPIK